MRTGRVLILFATLSLAATARAGVAEVEHRKARAWMAEAQHTANPIRLLVLSYQIRGALDEALRADPENVQIRLDLVRFYTVAPAVAGGDVDDARMQAAEIARRDAALGAFARGYIAYREEEYGPARHELREAVRTARDPTTRALAAKWLGWLSQETQQYDEAFATFESLRTSDASALYEIGRTAAFCGCSLERGRDALLAYLSARRAKEMPSAALARYHLALVHEKRGDLAAARREANAAWRADRKVTGLKELRRRLR